MRAKNKCPMCGNDLYKFILKDSIIPLDNQSLEIKLLGGCKACGFIGFLSETLIDMNKEI